MRKVFTAAVAVFVGLSAFSQNNWCGSDAYLNQLLENNPEQKAYYESMRDQQYALGQNGMAKRDGEKIIIPTVVHVMWSSCDGNISKAQIEDALRIMNEDFARTNPDTGLTREIFKPHAGALDVEFRLAQIDPNGQPTDGINRVETPLAVTANNNVKSIANWPTSKYFNIWVVESISFGGSGTVLGYAQFPGSGNWNTYGVVIRNDAMGTIGTSNADGRTLTHEAGHCFNLYHTFQDGCGNSCQFSGDRICDTPPSSEATWSCSFSLNTCANDAGGGSPYSFGTPDMIENFMSYNSCQNLFTKGQMDVMEAVFSNFSTLENLVSQSNLEATGVDGLLAADFEPANILVIKDEPAIINDHTRYDADGWEWDFGASSFPATSDVKSPEVTFIERGYMPVSLTASRTGMGDATVNKGVFVVSREGDFLPWISSFESEAAVPSDNWMPQNIDQDDTEWQVTNLAAFDGEQSLMVNNYGLCGGRSDYLYTPTLDLTPFTSANLRFNVAFAQRTFANNDFLRIHISRDLGQSWQLLWVQGGSSLRSIMNTESMEWYPSDTTEWIEKSVSISTNANDEGVVIRFEFASDGGNNFFMDNVRITGNFSGELLHHMPKSGTQGLKESVLIDWKAVGGIDAYEYQLDTESSFESENLIEGSHSYINEYSDNEDTEYLAEDLIHGETYFWRVRYVIDDSASEWTDPWTFTVSGDGLGQNEAALARSIHVFPNPTDEMLTIESAAKSLQQIVVYDLSGRVVLDEQLNNSTVAQLNLGDLQAGAYFVSITTSDLRHEVHTIMVQ